MASTLPGSMETGNRRRVSARLAELSGSATMAVDMKAKALRAAGRPVIGFGGGEPDFSTPQAIVDAAVAACSDPANHRYTPAPGLPELRAAIARKTLRDSGLVVEPDQVLVTNGGKQAIYEALAALVDPGDEVLVPVPYWTTYPEAVRLAGGRTVPVASDASTGFLPTLDALERARTDHTKVLLWCSPSNPGGAVADLDLVEAVARWAHRTGIWVVTDELYEHLVYDGAEHVSMPVALPELADRCVVVNGVAKAYAMTGWRVGWMIGPPDVIAAVTRLQSHLSSNVNNVAQHAALAAVTGPLDEVERMRAVFDCRRREVVRRLNDIDGVFCPVPRGAFYAFASVIDLLGRELRGRTLTTSVDLAEALLDEADVAVVPGEAFALPGHIRVSYVLANDDLRVGLDRMASLLSEAR